MVPPTVLTLVARDHEAAEATIGTRADKTVIIVKLFLNMISPFEVFINRFTACPLR